MKIPDDVERFLEFSRDPGKPETCDVCDLPIKQGIADVGTGRHLCRVCASRDPEIPGILINIYWIWDSEIKEAIAKRRKHGKK